MRTALFLVTLAVLAFRLPIDARNTFNLPSFTITLESTPNGVKLVSPDGSAWRELTFTLHKNKPQTIDEFGMSERLKEISANNADPAAYKITITKTNEGIQLTGIKGTAWKELSFTLSPDRKVRINQLGMAD